MIAYLLASLPTPRLTEPPEMDLDTFLERCQGFVSEERWHDLDELLASPSERGARASTASRERATRLGSRPDGSRDPVARRWRDLSDQIDDAVTMHRAADARRDPAPYLHHPSGYRVDLVEAVERAFAAQHPGARERALDELRWRLADELAAGERDGFAALYARAVHLRLAWRWTQWEAAAGWTALEANLRALEASHA